MPAFVNGDPYDLVRSQFPFFSLARSSSPVFMENAGGSQCPGVVIEAIADYMRRSYVQLGAGYSLSAIADSVFANAHNFAKVFVNCGEGGDVAFGASTSQLLAMLSTCYGRVLQKGDEVIVHEANHEANVAPWIRLAEMSGLSLKFWSVNYAQSFESSFDDLRRLLSPRTRIVAVAHVSNLLGEVMDLEKLVRYVKDGVGSEKVRIVADGVAYAPHRAIDVAKWGVDWYVFSAYKVYGPHMAVLFGSNEAFTDVKEATLNFDFVGRELSKQFELGSVSHESCAGILALGRYMNVLANSDRKSLSSEHVNSMAIEAEEREHLNSMAVEADERKLISEAHDQRHRSVLPRWPPIDRGVIESAFDAATRLEQPLQTMLISFLKSKRDVVIFGPTDANSETRVPTISFLHKRKSSSSICVEVQEAGFAVRNGHMYAPRLVAGWLNQNKNEDLLNPNPKTKTNKSEDILNPKTKTKTKTRLEEGVVRVSMVHYNTPAEVSQLIRCLDDIL